MYLPSSRTSSPASILPERGPHNSYYLTLPQPQMPSPSPRVPLNPQSPWAQLLSDSGEPYYYNETTGETTWDAPREGVRDSERLQESAPSPSQAANGDAHWVPGEDDDELEEVGDEQPQHNGHVSAAAKPRRKKPRGKGKGKGGGRRRRRKRGNKPSAQQQQQQQHLDPDHPPPRRRRPRRPNETAAQMHAWAMDKSPAEERVHFMRFGSSPLSSPSAYSPTGTPLS